MPKHLYTIPSGTTLPDVTGLPEGSPFLLVTSDLTVPGKLYVLQDTDFVQVASPPSIVTQREQVTFVAKIPAKPVADATPQDITAMYEGVAGGRFIMPVGLASGSTTVGQLREITLAMDTATPPLDTVTLGLLVDTVAFPPTATGFALTDTIDHVHTNVTYNAVTTANRMVAGSAITAAIHVGGAYANVDDAYVIITLWFGEPEGAGAGLESLMTGIEDEVAAGGHHL